jgi:hypothetical protein
MKHDQYGYDFNGGEFWFSFGRISYTMRSQCMVKVDAKGVDFGINLHQTDILHVDKIPIF